METKLTAVEWLVEQIFLNKKYITYEESIAFEQAKAMEKDQHFESYRLGNSFLDSDKLDFEGYFEQYYNETYNK